MSKTIQSHILQDYIVIKELGSGAYGYVWQVQQKTTKRHFALKKVFDAFRNSIDAQRTYRQVEILHQLKHENIVQLFKVMKSRNKRDLYLLFEHMEVDLHSVVGYIQSLSRTQVLSRAHKIYVFYQLLKALKYLHSADLIHRDLKPSNALLNSDCCVKLCDFGLARSLTTDNQEQIVMSEEVATKWYRAPELLLGSKSYHKPADMWSIGCIVAELLIGKPLFAGNSTLNQIEKILEFTGHMKEEDIHSLDAPAAEQLIEAIIVKEVPFEDYFANVPYQFHPLLKGLLERNPNKRVTVDQALRFPIFSDFSSDFSRLKVCSKPITLEINDNIRMATKTYQQRIYEDIDKRYNPHPFKDKKESILKLTEKLRKQSKGKVDSHHKSVSLKKFCTSQPSSKGHIPTGCLPYKSKSLTVYQQGSNKNHKKTVIFREAPIKSNYLPDNNQTSSVYKAEVQKYASNKFSDCSKLYKKRPLKMISPANEKKELKQSAHYRIKSFLNHFR